LGITEINGSDDFVFGEQMTLPSGAKLTVYGDSFSYLPAPGSTDPDSFTYTVSDGTSSGTATVDIDVTDTAPDAANDGYHTIKNKTLTASLGWFGLSGNDGDAD